MLLSCDLSTKRLSVFKVTLLPLIYAAPWTCSTVISFRSPKHELFLFLQVVRIDGETFIPTSLGAGAASAEFLWLVMGVSSLNASESGSLARVRVLSGFGKTDQEPSFLEDKDVPGGEAILQKLQGDLCIKTEVFLTAAEAVKTAMRNLLIKKQYSAERREFRKRGRNDKKK